MGQFWPLQPRRGAAKTQPHLAMYTSVYQLCHLKTPKYQWPQCYCANLLVPHVSYYLTARIKIRAHLRCCYYYSTSTFKPLSMGKKHFFYPIWRKKKKITGKRDTRAWIFSLKRIWRTSLVVQGLRLRAPSAEGRSVSPGRGTKIPHA